MSMLIKLKQKIKDKMGKQTFYVKHIKPKNIETNIIR